MREFMTGNVTSVFSRSDQRPQALFHGYCDLADRARPIGMKAAIIERESRLVRAMKREEGLEHIWSSTQSRLRRYRLANRAAGRRTVPCSVEAWERR
jgi:hypothetical protein